MIRIQIIQGDITILKSDVIVNAANEQLLGGGGVDGAIHRAAGPELLAACKDIKEEPPGIRCPTGECRITPGFELPSAFVIHTVGPVWKGGRKDEGKALRNCYRGCLSLAEKNDLKTIAFPAISCGVFGYPLKQASEIAIETITSFPTTKSSLRLVLLVAYNREIRVALKQALG